MRKIVCSWCAQDWQIQHCCPGKQFGSASPTVIVEGPDRLSDDHRMSLKAVRFQFVMKDPYPELSTWQQMEGARNIFGKFFPSVPKPEISPHKAWQDGFEFAWDLFNKRIDEL